MNEEELWKLIEQDTKDTMSNDRWKKLSEDIDMAIKEKQQFSMSRSPNNTIAHIVNDPIKVSPYNEMRVSTGQAVKSITEEHQAHVSAHKLAIDNYNVEKQVEVLTEILAEIRSINKKLRKKVKK